MSTLKSQHEFPCMKTWHNFAKNKEVFIQGAPPDDELDQYLPLIPGAKGLYRTYIGKGKKHMEAYILVMEFIFNH